MRTRRTVRENEPAPAPARCTTDTAPHGPPGGGPAQIAQIGESLLEQTHIVLVTGPFTGRTSMLDTADALRAAGAEVTEPDPHALHPDALPGLEDWAHSLLAAIPRAPRPLMVGFSAGTVLAAWLAPQVAATGLVLIDGALPPRSGPCPILSDEVRAHLRGRAAPDALPTWSDWWDADLAEPLGHHRLARARPDLVEALRAEERAFPLDWLEQTLDLPPCDGIPAAYLRLSRFHDAEAELAASRGWPVERIDGSHLHPAFAGNETAGAILALAGRMELGPQPEG